MDQAASDMETEAEQPKDEQDYKHGPKHGIPLLSYRQLTSGRGTAKYHAFCKRVKSAYDCRAKDAVRGLSKKGL